MKPAGYLTSMVKKAKPVRRRKALKRNPHAMALGSPLFRARVERNPFAYKRRPKHAKPAEETGGA